MLILIELVVVLVIAYSALGWTLFFFQSTFIFKPLRGVHYTPDELGLDFEDVTLKTKDGIKLNAWYIPAENAEFTMLFCHGNGGNIMHRLDSINFFYKLGINCLIFDYRGYGKSGGKPTEEGIYQDAKTAYKWLTKTKKIPPEKIILFGRSLGGSIAAQLATKVKPKSLVIESCFTSYVDIGKKFYPYMPVKLFAKYRYDTLSYIKKISCPVMIFHSRGDQTIPFEFGLEIYETANEPKEFVEIFGDHNDAFLVSAEIYTNAWKKWLESLKNEKVPASQPAS